jgi:uncharacterized SAM-binding protein YcdF (DUF218 family)
MDFILSKALWLAVNPGNLLLLLVGAGLFASRWRKLAVAGWLLLLVLSVLPIGRAMLVPLETRFQTPTPPPAKVDGVVVLGGFVDPVMSARTGQVELGGAAERLFAMLELARRYPEAKIVFSGGSGSVLHPEASEAPLVKRLLEESGIDSKRFVFEDRSRNSFENATFSREIAQPKDGETWLLVTSAAHMPRAVGCFRGQNWPVLAWPVDHATAGGIDWADIDFNLSGRLGVLGYALHEWIGLVSYRLMGRTPNLFPAP